MLSLALVCYVKNTTACIMIKASDLHIRPRIVFPHCSAGEHTYSLRPFLVACVHICTRVGMHVCPCAGARA